MNEPHLEDSTVVVTGGAGFIGSHIARTLVDDNEVRVLDDCSTGSPADVPDGAELVTGDVRDEDIVADVVTGADVVFHEAAEVSVTRSIEQPKRSHAVNVEGTVNVLEAAREADARVVVASSCAIYGVPEEVPLSETAATDPQSPYAIDKMSVDAYARIYHDLYGLETVALRYFNVYGPGQTAGEYSGVISIFVKQARHGEPITVEGSGEQTRDFVHVDDVVRANLAAATTNDVGEAFNVGTGQETSILTLAETVDAAVGGESDIVHVEAREADVPRSRADLSKARKSIGYEPQVGLTEGLRTVVEDV